MPTKTITAKLTKKAGNGKGFLLEGYENWFNASEKVMPFLAKIEVGKTVEISYFQKGVNSIVTLIKEVSKEAKTQETTTEEKTNKPKCEVCGKELKGKSANYPTCWECKNKTPKENKEKETNKGRTYNNYDNPEKTAQIQRGNALNAAGTAVSGNLVGAEPGTIAEAVKVIAEQLLDWLRAE